jgi:hypothetical protein
VSLLSAPATRAPVRFKRGLLANSVFDVGRELASDEGAEATCTRPKHLLTWDHSPRAAMTMEPGTFCLPWRTFVLEVLDARSKEASTTQVPQ